MLRAIRSVVTAIVHQQLKQKLAVALIILIHSPLAIADSEASAGAPKHLIIAAYDSPPTAWLLQDGTVVGTNPLWIEGFFEAVGETYELNYRLGPSQRIRSDLITGHADCALITPNENLTRYTTEIAQLEPLSVGIWSRRDNPITSKDDLSQFDIYTSYRYRKLVETRVDQIHFVPTSGRLLYILLSGRTDGILSVDHFVSFNIHRAGAERKNFHRIDFVKLPVSFVCSNKSRFAGQFPKWQTLGPGYSSENPIEKIDSELLRRYNSDPRYRSVGRLE